MNRAINRFLKRRESGLLIITSSLLLAFWLMSLKSLVMFVASISNCSIEQDKFSAITFVYDCRVGSLTWERILTGMIQDSRLLCGIHMVLCSTKY
jgi:hypothetical protein